MHALKLRKRLTDLLSIGFQLSASRVNIAKLRERPIVPIKQIKTPNLVQGERFNIFSLI